jgi:hypothetical protein
MLKETQARFWAVNMGRPPAYDPIAEAEYLLEGDLATAEHDGTLRYLASTYDAASDRLSPGTGRTGPRVLDFAPLLRVREWPLNDVLLDLVSLAEASLEQPVEIELAATLPTSSDGTVRVGLVQVRAMSTPDAEVVVTEEDLTGPTLLLASRRVMGNGDVESVRDVVYLRPDTFDPSHCREMAVEVAAANRRLMDEERPYLLLGFGRWGSSDPWLGVPVTWGQVAGARIIVEASLPTVRIDPSQGSHFFHNVSSLGVMYFSLGAAEPTDVRWTWLEALPAVSETGFVRHVRLEEPLRARVDGRSGRGFVRWGGASPPGLAE